MFKGLRANKICQKSLQIRLGNSRCSSTISASFSSEILNSVSELESNSSTSSAKYTAQTIVKSHVISRPVSVTASKSQVIIKKANSELDVALVNRFQPKRKYTDEEIIEILAIVAKLLSTKAKISHSTFRTILKDLFRVNQHCSKKYRELSQQLKSLESNSAKILKSITVAKRFKRQSVDTARALFASKAAYEDARLQDYELMLRFESSNKYFQQSHQLIKDIDERFPQQASSSTSYWNLKFKILANCNPRFWKFSNPKYPGSNQIPLSDNVWNGSTPFSYSSINLLSQVVSLIESRSLSPDSQLANNIILGLGYSRDTDLLKRYLLHVWGLGEEEESSRIKMTPNIHTMKAILTAFSFNGKISEAIEYSLMLCEKYNIHLEKTEKLHFHETLLKWAELNFKVPSSSLTKLLLQESDPDITPEQVSETLDKTVQQSIEHLDRIFFAIIESNTARALSFAILETRFRHLRKLNRLKQMIRELPVFYEAYTHNLSNASISSLYSKYLRTVLSMSMEGEISSLKAKLENHNSANGVIVEANKALAKQFEKNGLFWMFEENQANSKNFKRLIKEIDGFIAQLKAHFESRDIVNGDIMRIVLLYRCYNDVKMEELKKYYVESNKKVVTLRKELSDMFFKEDDENEFMELF